MRVLFPPDTKYVVFSQYHFSDSLTQTRYPVIQLNSDTSSLQLGQTAQLKASAPQDCPHFRCQWEVLGHLYFWLTCYKSEVPRTPFSGPIICQNGSQNPGRPFTYMYQFIIKHVHEPHEEVDGEMSGRVSNPGSVELKCVTFPAHRCIHQPKSPPNPLCTGVYRRFIR